MVLHNNFSELEGIFPCSFIPFWKIPGTQVWIQRQIDWLASSERIHFPEPHFPQFNLGMVVKHKLQPAGTWKNNWALFSLGKKKWWITRKCGNIRWRPQSLLSFYSPTSPALQQDEELGAISVLEVREGVLDQPGLDQEMGTDLFGTLCWNLNFWIWPWGFVVIPWLGNINFLGFTWGWGWKRELGAKNILG